MKRRMEKNSTKATVLAGGLFVVAYSLARRKFPDSVYDNDPEQKNPQEGKKVVFVEDARDEENADGIKGHLEAVGASEESTSFYQEHIKRVLDITLSFGGLLVLSPVLGAIALAIKIDDPGPVLFTQKRVGKNKKYFKLHKFRSMKMSTPHDVPTHMLDNPEQYITRVGRFIRAHSLDELPQIWDIFIGNMSVIGPRPALWNQDRLTALRDEYGVNEIKPGLTGWAQINGRDELELTEKARYDGEYAEEIRKGGMAAIKMDCKCFFNTVISVARSEGVVEGGTGAMNDSLRPGVPEEDPKTPFGCDLKMNVDTQSEKRVLITGAGSYIGESVKAYAAENYPNLSVDSIDMIDGSWRECDFSKYDTVYHVAGIAHADVGNVSDETKEKYYAVNTDLAIETARKAKADGVSQFIFMSSMIVYGDSAPFGTKKRIDRNTKPSPDNFYGDSKWQADKGVRALADERFKVAVLRPPMIYGKGSKGNYPTLARMAKKLPIFPDIDNERSMLYIENLCEFVCNLIMSGEGGLYFPQNSRYTKTSEMVKHIAKMSNHRILESRMLKSAVGVAARLPGKVGDLANKAFGNLSYNQNISKYNFDYQRYSLEDSIRLTEGSREVQRIQNPKISIITICYNSESYIKKTIESVLSQDYSGEVEYLIIDGASDDSTLSIAESYRPMFASKGYSYDIFSEKDAGIYDAMNKGIKKATGEIIGIINAGDWYEPNALTVMMNTYENNPFDMFYADINLIKKDGSVIVKHSKKDTIITSRHWNHPTSFVLKSLYEELGLFRCEGIHDDFEFFLRVKREGKKIVIKNEVLANFTTGGTSNSKSLKKSIQRVKDRYRCYRTNGYSRIYVLECLGIELAKAIIS